MAHCLSVAIAIARRRHAITRDDGLHWRESSACTYLSCWRHPGSA
jgi:hypothetical protein